MTATLAPTPTPTLDPGFLAAFRAGTLTEDQAIQFAQRDPLEIQFLLLQLSLAIAVLPGKPGPHTPPSAIPPFAKPKPQSQSQSKKKRGGQPGHPGETRPEPEHIDRTQTHVLPPCPCCGGTLASGKTPRTRIIEDIPANLQPEVVEHIIPRGYCNACHKQYEAPVPDALPQARLGHRAVALTAWLHYGLGTTTSQVVDVLNGHLHTPISEGGLTGMWHRLAEVLTPWYEQIQDECLQALVLHLDETSWRTAGVPGWLWVATTRDATYYWIHRTRGHEALDEFFVQEFNGVMVTDFYQAYDAVAKDSQKCWPHLLRDLKEIDNRESLQASEKSEEWREFSRRVKKIYGDGIRLKLARDRLSVSEFENRRMGLQGRLDALGEAAWGHVDAARLGKRLGKYRDALLTFVDHRDVPPDNNHGERILRPAVLMRKASYGTGSDRGSQTRSILMSIYRTLKQRGVDVLAVTESALRTYMTTGKLPPLPAAITSTG